MNDRARGSTGAGGFDGCVEGEDVGLEGDFFNDFDDLRDFATRLGDFRHRDGPFGESTIALGNVLIDGGGRTGVVPAAWMRRWTIH